MKRKQKLYLPILFLYIVLLKTKTFLVREIETMKVETYNFGVWVLFEYQFEIDNYAFF
jgi:hypothetical protein